MDASKPVSLAAFGSGSPKSPKSTQTAPSAPTSAPTDAQLLVFALTECKAFFGKLATTIQTAAEEGKHPATLLKGEKKAGTGTPKEPKVKRKPSAFNVFVRKTLEQAKKEREDIGEDSQGGPENNAIFGQASAAWKALSEEQRKAYQQIYANNSEDPALDDLPEPEAGAATGGAAKAENASNSLDKKRKKDAVEGPKGPEAKAASKPVSPDAEGKKKKKKKKSGVPATDS